MEYKTRIISTTVENILTTCLIALLVFGCKDQQTHSSIGEEQRQFNQKLENKLQEMAEIDQIAAKIPQGKYKKLQEEEWKLFQDSVFKTHQKKISEILNEHGYPGFNLVGKEGSKKFWLMTQHSDHNPEFQQKVLEKMKVEVEKGNADPKDFAFLTDRVNLNIGEPQIYGTQVTYNTELCQAIPKNLQDSINVNNRRKAVGLEPLEFYLNEMSSMHFQMNKERYIEKGINRPQFYKVDGHN